MKCKAQVQTVLALDKKRGVPSVRTTLAEEQLGKDTDAFVDEGHVVERILCHSFYYLYEREE